MIKVFFVQYSNNLRCSPPFLGCVVLHRTIVCESNVWIWIRPLQKSGPDLSKKCGFGSQKSNIFQNSKIWIRPLDTNLKKLHAETLVKNLQCIFLVGSRSPAHYQPSSISSFLAITVYIYLYIYCSVYTLYLQDGRLQWFPKCSGRLSAHRPLPGRHSAQPHCHQLRVSTFTTVIPPALRIHAETPAIHIFSDALKTLLPLGQSGYHPSSYTTVFKPVRKLLFSAH